MQKYYKNIIYILFIIVIIFTFIYIFVKLSTISNKNIVGHDKLKNIYGEPLKPCQINNNSENKGSWDDKGYCSELDGGVHQICFNVNNDTSDFSSKTGQSNWSEDRIGNNHCMCLGAWALYKAKNEGTDKELQCESIPEIALSENYVKNWNKWNGNELPDQIIKGVDSLVKQCHNKKSSDYLKNNYDKLRNTYNSDWESIL